MFKKLFKRWQCSHAHTQTITNLYGDFININNAKSVKICEDCHKIIFCDEIDKNCNKRKFMHIGRDDCDSL